MKELTISVVEPFTSPAWGSSFAVFSSDTGLPIPEAQSKDYLRRCCNYAQRYEVWLVPERFIISEHQCMGLVNPGGEVMGVQKAIHDSPAFKSSGKENTKLEVFSTGPGGVFLCVDADIYRPEVACIAGNMGAQVIICSQSIASEDYSNHMVLTGVWNAAQLAGVYVVAATNQFNCVCAPIELTPLGDGFLNAPGLKMPMTQRLSTDKLGKLRKPKALNRKFYAIHREELIG